MRKGKYKDGVKDNPLISVIPLTGYIFANAFISFIVNLIIGTCIWFVLFWLLTW